MKKAAIYIAIGVVAVPLSIVSHELGHFFAYYLFGASGIKLRAFSVADEKESLGSIQLALAAIIGPLITYLTIALSAFFLKRKYAAFWMILALAAPIGRIVNFPYIFFRLAGYNPNPNFDEFNFSKSLGIEPLFISSLTACLIIAIFSYFLRAAWKEGGLKEILLIAAGLAAGLAIWSFGGELLLP